MIDNYDDIVTFDVDVFLKFIIILFSLFSVFMLFFILISRFTKNRKEAFLEKFRLKCEATLMNLMFDDEYAKPSENYTSAVHVMYLESFHPDKRTVLMQSLLTLLNDLSGDFHRKVITIYHDMKMPEFAYNMLKSQQLADRINAVRELALFNVTEAVPIINNLVSHPGPELRAEAQFALVKLIGVDGLSFVPNANYIITEWQQLRLMELVKNQTTENQLEFYRWLKVSNLSVIKFTLRLISHFNQFEKSQYIYPLIHHPNEDIRIAAINCLVSLQDENFLHIATEKFNEESNRIKIRLLKAIEEMNVKSYMIFVKHYIKYPVHEVAMQAMYTMKALDQVQTEASSLQFTGRVKDLFDHVLDERI